MNRRGFIGSLLAAAILDPEKLLWVPGRKLISIPAPRKIHTLKAGDRLGVRLMGVTSAPWSEYAFFIADQDYIITELDFKSFGQRLGSALVGLTPTKSNGMGTSYARFMDIPMVGRDADFYIKRGRPESVTVTLTTESWGRLDKENS